MHLKSVTPRPGEKGKKLLEGVEQLGATSSV
jgi:hypothetical protein